MFQIHSCENIETASKLTEVIVTPKRADSEKHFFICMFDEGEILENEENIEAAMQFQKEEEIKNFSKLIANKDFCNQNLS